MVCKDLECFEADSFGKFIPLSRHVASALIKSPSNDDFVKDVTDTFRQKVMKPSLCLHLLIILMYIFARAATRAPLVSRTR